MPNPRADYSPIFDRPPLTLPDGARVAVWFIINVRSGTSPSHGPHRAALAPGAAVSPDIPNYSWFDYGMRVGFWRLQRALSDLNLPCTVSLNAAVCEEYPQLVQSCLDRDWELLGHGYIQQVLHKEPDERATIRRPSRSSASSAAAPPAAGWAGAGRNLQYPRHPGEEGIEYVAIGVNDDQPYALRVQSGRLVALPYTVELNDIPIYLVQHHSRRSCSAAPKTRWKPCCPREPQRPGHGHLHPPLHHRRGPSHRPLRRLLEYITQQKACPSGPAAAF